MPQTTVDATEQEEWETQALRSRAWPARAPVRPVTTRSSGRATVRRFQEAVAAVPSRLPRGKTLETSSSSTASTRRCRGDGGALRPSSGDPSRDGVAFHGGTTWSRQFNTMSSTRQQQGTATGTATAGVTPSRGYEGRSRSSRWRPSSNPSPKNGRNLGGVLDNPRGFAAFNKATNLAMHSQAPTKMRHMSSALPPRFKRGDDARGVPLSPRKRGNVSGRGRGGRVVMAQMMVPTVVVCFGQESTGGQDFVPVGIDPSCSNEVRPSTAAGRRTQSHRHHMIPNIFSATGRPREPYPRSTTSGHEDVRPASAGLCAW